MKLFLRILLLLVLLNISCIGISFYLPGRIGFVDSYSLYIEKGVIELMEKKGTRPIDHGDQADPFTTNALSFEELSPYLDEIKPGTLFFSDHGRTVSAKFIEGSWKHCGIYLGTLDQIQSYWGKDNDLVQSLQTYYTSEEECLIFDSSYEYGVAIHSIKELADLSHNSTLRSLLFIECSPGKEEWSQILLSGKEHLGKEYDYFFVLEDENSLYCSEFLYTMLPLEKSNVTPSRKILGRKFLLPSDLVQSILKSGETNGDFMLKGTISKSDGQIIHSLDE